MVRAASTSSPLSNASTPQGDGRAMGDGGQARQEFAAAWKGWTNGGGERSPTAAQFSRIAESGFTMPAINPVAATNGANRAAPSLPAMPAAVPTPTPEAAALAPIHAALERFVSRSQQSLAVTVRFEQGGSLSLQLSMSEAGIKTHIHTDVPGLESVLRSGWDSFAQDWNQRGVKLGSLTFGGHAASGESGAGREHAGQHSADRHGAGADGQAPGLGFSGFRRPGTGHGRRSGPVHPQPELDVAAPATALPGLLPRGLHTWA